MSAAQPGNAALFDFKSATLSLEAFLLRTANLTSLARPCKSVGGGPTCSMANRW